MIRELISKRKVAAIQWNKQNFDQIKLWVIAQVYQDTDGNLILYTPFGMVRVLSGQWVVRYELGDNVFYTAMNTKEIKDNYEFK